MPSYLEADSFIRPGLEENVLSWSHVTTRFMFGCLAYLARGKLFAFLVDESVVITRLDEDSRQRLAAGHEAFAFRSKGKSIGDWIQVVVTDEAELDDLMDYVRKSYEAALKKTK